MKTVMRPVVILIAITVMCQAGIVQANNFNWLGGGDQAASQQTPCDSCCPAACSEEACGGGCGCDPVCCNSLGCDGCENGLGIVGFAGLDAFKGISDGSYESNFGAVTGLNSGTPLLGLSEYGIGWQTGISYGVYDFDGWGDPGDERVGAQQQVFVTTGVFRKAPPGRRLSFGLVYDWMFNKNWGVFAVSPTVGQWRGQIEYALSGCNSVGVWGCVNDLYSVQNSPLYGTRIRNAGVTQANMFWHHKFNRGADSWLWVGIPERTSLTGVGSLGDWMVGANVQVPLSDRLALYANGSYLHPTASAGIDAAMSSGFDVSMGVCWYFGRRAISHAINGDCWMPYMPMANNSNFLVDQGHAF